MSSVVDGTSKASDAMVAEQVVLLGASVRALAFSALSAASQPICYDLFADWDLCQHAEAHRIAPAGYPHDFLQCARHLAGRPWMYTGGLENYPDLLDRLAEQGPLWGNAGSVVRLVRDPCRLQGALADIVTPVPVCISDNGIPTDDSWLVKPRRSAGGAEIRPWRGGVAPTNSYWQQHVPGPSYAAVFLASDTSVTLAGVTRQYVGESFCRASPFAYCGSIGPVVVPDATLEQLCRAGQRLAERFGLRGLFGLDFISDERGVHPLEVNPRYPASAEILERAGVIAAFASQRAVFSRQEEICRQTSPPAAPIHGKAILFAARPCQVRADAPCYRQEEEASSCRFADIPWPGTAIPAGAPILTLFATGEYQSDCEKNLRQATRDFEETETGLGLISGQTSGAQQ